MARDLEDKRHRLIARSRLGAPSTPRLLKLTVPALERRLDASEAGAAERPSADGACPPTTKRLRADAKERAEGRINALEPCVRNQNYSVPVTLAIRRSDTIAISSVP